MASRLKTCPFCGEIPDQILYREETIALNRSYYSISHMCHDGSVYICITGDTYQEVVEKWNNRRRTQDDQD